MDRLRRNFERDLAELPVPSSRLGWPVVTDADLVALPVAAATYLRAMGVIGWLPCEAWQYDTNVPRPTRVYDMRLDLNGHGLPTNFRTYDRWCALPTGLVRAPWSTPIDDWIVVDDRPFPGVAAAVCDLPDGPFRYAEGRFDPDSIVFDTPVPQLVGS